MDELLNWTSIFIGVLAVSTAAYLAAVYLAADAARAGRPDLCRDFRARALGAGVVAGALAVVGLPIVHHDAPALWDGLTSGWGLAAVAVSGVAGAATLALVYGSGFEPARVTSAVAVTAIIAGWALAQRPQFLPGLTIEEAAAGRSSLIAVIVPVAIGAVVLVLARAPVQPVPARTVRPAHGRGAGAGRPLRDASLDSRRRSSPSSQQAASSSAPRSRSSSRTRGRTSSGSPRCSRS